MHALPEPVRRVLTAAIVAGPVVVALGTLTGVLRGNVFSDVWHGGINVTGTGIWILGVVGLTLALAEKAPRLGAVLLTLGVVFSATGGAWGVDYMTGAVHGERIVLATTAAIPFVALPGALFPLTLAVIAIALWRTGVVPSTAGIALAVGALLFPAGRMPEIGALALTADVVLILGSALCAAAIGDRASAPATAGSLV